MTESPLIFSLKSNSFTVREAGASINHGCGANGTTIIVTGYDYDRDSAVYVDNLAGASQFFWG